jgi:hypothetical protein
MKIKNENIKDLLISVFAIFAIIGVFTILTLVFRIYSYQSNDYSLRPPDDLRTIEDFQKWMPEVREVIETKVRKSTYYLILGKSRKLPSGPSGYTFDQHGNFVEWSEDIGDIRTPRIVFENIDFSTKPIEEVIQEINEVRKNEN